VVGKLRCEDGTPIFHKWTTRRRDGQTRENLYNVLQDANQQDKTFVTLKKLKGKIVRQHAPLHRPLLHNDDEDKIVYENPSLYHTPKLRKRQDSWTVDGI
jgi:hypothetical protein